MPYHRSSPGAETPPRRGAAFRTTLSDSESPQCQPLYGENEDDDDDSPLAFDDAMCVTIEHPPFHGNRILAISNACLAPERTSIYEVDLPVAAAAAAATSIPPDLTNAKRRLSTKISSVFSPVPSQRPSPTKRARLQPPNPTSESDFFFIASASQIRTYSPSDIMGGNGSRHHHRTKPSSSPRKLLLSSMAAQAKAAMRPIIAIKTRYGGAMSSKKVISPSRGTKCVVVGA